jgi:pimeloyl-ACP methyl ester carboxylesterase
MNFKVFKTNPLPKSVGKDPKPDTVVLFIHGLGGSFGTWSSFARYLKDIWSEADSFGLSFDKYYGDQSWYHKIPVLNWILIFIKVALGPGIKKLSKSLNTTIDSVCHNYDNVIIVAHSMGGLVARQYLIDQMDKSKTLGKVKCLITYATPHKGSRIANVAIVLLWTLFHRYKNPRQLVDLLRDGGYVKELNQVWKNYRIDQRTDFDFIRVFGYDDWVVDEDSSSFVLDSNIEDPNIKPLAGRSHFTIIQPDKRTLQDPSVMITYTYLQQFRDKLESENERKRTEETEID